MKIILLGNEGIGKTSLFENYLGRGAQIDFVENLNATFKQIHRQIPTDGGPADIKIYLWDIADHSSFKTENNYYYLGVDGIILIYDITRRETLHSLSGWLKEVNKNNKYPNTNLLIPEKEHIPIALIGNKNDLREERNDPVTQEEVNSIIESIKKQYEVNLRIPHHETSIKSDLTVTNAFNKIFQHFVGFISIHEIT